MYIIKFLKIKKLIKIKIFYSHRNLFQISFQIIQHNIHLIVLIRHEYFDTFNGVDDPAGFPEPL